MRRLDNVISRNTTVKKEGNWEKVATGENSIQQVLDLDGRGIKTWQQVSGGIWRNPPQTPSAATGPNLHQLGGFQGDQSFSGLSIPA